MCPRLLKNESRQFFAELRWVVCDWDPIGVPELSQKAVDMIGKLFDVERRGGTKLGYVAPSFPSFQKELELGRLRLFPVQV